MQKQQILIVDDEEINRVILKGLFQDEYAVIEATNGQEAIAQLESENDFILVLLDIVMPVMNGFGVLQYMKEHDLLEQTPVILITGETVIDSEDQAYSFGVADVMHKPFYPHIVKRRAKNIIELYQNKHYMQERLKEQEEAIRKQEKQILEGYGGHIPALRRNPDLLLGFKGLMLAAAELNPCHQAPRPPVQKLQFPIFRNHIGFFYLIQGMSPERKGYPAVYLEIFFLIKIIYPEKMLRVLYARFREPDASLILLVIPPFYQRGDKEIRKCIQI